MFQSNLILISTILLSLLVTSIHGAGLRGRTGKYYDGIDGRIINGVEATQEDTEHQISLRRRLYDGFFFGAGHICGGSLIRQNVVLTAAHCIVDQNIYDGTFVDKDTLIVVMGNLDKYNSTDTLTYDIKKLVLPFGENEKFNLSTYDKDLALLFLSGSVPIGYPGVSPIAMTSVAIAPNTMCQVTGWGTTELGYASDKLMTVDVPVISDEECRTESDLNPNLLIAGMICAGYMELGEKDACSGDSGGPMVCDNLLSGIVSWGISCAQPKLPGVYTEVAYYYEWIEAEIEAYVESGDGDGDDDNSGDGSGDGSGEGSGGNNSGDGGGDDDDSGSGSGSGDGSGDDDDGGAAMISIIASVTLLIPSLLTIIHAIN